MLNILNNVPAGMSPTKDVSQTVARR